MFNITHIDSYFFLFMTSVIGFSFVMFVDISVMKQTVILLNDLLMTNIQTLLTYSLNYMTCRLYAHYHLPCLHFLCDINMIHGTLTKTPERKQNKLET